MALPYISFHAKKSSTNPNFTASGSSTAKPITLKNFASCQKPDGASPGAAASNNPPADLQQDS
jgi:hypothetical protein